jgi:large subunit ribosomal protein L21
MCKTAESLFDACNRDAYNSGFRCEFVAGTINFWSLTMYAVIKTGGKQYRVAAGEKIKVEQIPADVGSQVVLDQVLMVGNGEAVTIGKPLVNGAQVTATVVSHGRADKVKIFKMRRRKHYQKRQGHRQNFTELQIGEIKA